MVYLTGDTHGDFCRIADFCKRFETSVDDVMIILGDAGINFSGRAGPSAWAWNAPPCAGSRSPTCG